MRKFKTSKNNRTNYVYYTVKGEEILIQPRVVDEEGKAVTEEMITILHRMDDDEFDSDRREHDHCPVSLTSYHDGEGEDVDDRNPYLADNTYNPLEQLLISMEKEERSNLVERLKEPISELTEKQQSTIIKKFYNNMSNVDIAAEEGVTETAIRNRLTKIYAQLRKKLK